MSCLISLMSFNLVQSLLTSLSFEANEVLWILTPGSGCAGFARTGSRMPSFCFPVTKVIKLFGDELILLGPFLQIYFQWAHRALVFAAVWPFKPSTMFVDKNRSITYSGAPERCFTRIGYSLNRKHYKFYN